MTKYNESTVNRGDIARVIAREARVNLALATAALDGALEAIANTLAAGGEVQLTGFGKFTVTTRAGGRTIRNPRTGEPLEAKTRDTRKPKFSPSLPLRRAIDPNFRPQP